MLKRNILDDNLTLSAYVLRQRLEDCEPTIGLVLGSGLNPLANEIADAASIPYAEVPRMKTIRPKAMWAASSAARWAASACWPCRVVCTPTRGTAPRRWPTRCGSWSAWACARLSPRTRPARSTRTTRWAISVSWPIRSISRGAIPSPRPTRRTCRTASSPCWTRSTPSCAPSPTTWRPSAACAVEGVYLGALGPSFETPAEIRMFRSWGADTVAISVCEEVIAARHVGMRVLGISLVSNMGCGIEGASPTGLEVLDVAKTREGDFSRLITGIVEQL